jgi:CRISPR-associated protein Cas5h
MTSEARTWHWNDPLDKGKMTSLTEPKGKVLVFDIWGDYAHYRNIETTTSPLTYSVPTGTALMGMISAIIGLDRDSYYTLLAPEKVRFAIKILRTIKKARINITLVDTSRGFFLRDIGENPRSLIPHEFVQDPKYKVFVWFESDDLRTKLRGFLKEHKSHYTPCLGTANLIADFAYVSESNLERTDHELIHSVARMDNGNLVIEQDKRYFIERIPVYMNQDRVVQDFAEVVYEVNGKPVKMSDVISYSVGSDNLVFL